MRFRYWTLPQFREAQAQVAAKVAATPQQVEELAEQARGLYQPAPQLKATSEPGLFEQMTGRPLPSYRELRAIYGDPADLPPILPRHREALASGAVAGGLGRPACAHQCEHLYESECANQPRPCRMPGETGQQVADQIKATANALRDAVGVSATDVGKVDFRDMLKDDGAAWSVKARLEKVLGRAYLATALADQLAPDVAVMLADRLDKLVEQAVADHELATAREVAAAVTRKVQEYRDSHKTRTEAVTHERFGRNTRLD